MKIEPGTTVDVVLGNKDRVAYVGRTVEIRNTHHGVIEYVDQNGTKHRFKTTDKKHMGFKKMSADTMQMTLSSRVGFPDSPYDATVFVLSRGKVVGYGSYNEYMHEAEKAA